MMFTASDGRRRLRCGRHIAHRLGILRCSSPRRRASAAASAAYLSLRRLFTQATQRYIVVGSFMSALFHVTRTTSIHYRSTPDQAADQLHRRSLLDRTKHGKLGVVHCSTRPTPIYRFHAASVATRAIESAAATRCQAVKQYDQT